MVVALGITWILDGLEVTLAGAVSLAGDFHEHLGGALRKRQIVLDHRYEIAVGEILLRSDQVAADLENGPEHFLGGLPPSPLITPRISSSKRRARRTQARGQALHRTVRLERVETHIALVGSRAPGLAGRNRRLLR